jgi:hypothetical protein
LLRGKATGLGLLRRAGLRHQHTKDGQPPDEIACGRFELAPLHLGEAIPPFRGPALLDHVAENEDEVSLHGFVLAEAVARSTGMAPAASARAARNRP